VAVPALRFIAQIMRSLDAPPVKSGFEQRDSLEGAEALRLEDAELTPAFALRRARQLCPIESVGRLYC
jgi:hypothetical protein